MLRGELFVHIVRKKLLTCGSRMSAMAKMAIDMRQPHVSNVENGGYGPFVLSGDSRPICLIWLSATIRLPLIPMTLLAHWGLRRYILRQSRTGVKFLVLSRSSLNTAIWLLKMIEISLLTTINYCKTTLRDFSY